MKIGVFICHCGNNIGATVDVEKVARTVLQLPHVVYTATTQYTCADAGQQSIRTAIKERGLTQVVVASCSPLVHENTFRRTVAKAGLNPYRFEMANIREHCSWIHEDREQATLKAFEIIKMAVAKVARDESLYASQTGVTKRVLIIGAGIAGIQTALDIAEGGVDVVLIDSAPSIGGNMAKLDKVFPTLDCSACILSPKMVEVYQHEKIKLYSYTEVERVSGYIGNFKVTLRRKSRYVNEKSCTGCGECGEVCPIELPNEFNEGLDKRNAIYVPFPQAVPKVATVDKRGAAPCRSACPLGARAQGYVSLIARGKFDEALRVIMKDNPFPSICGRVCQHPCEDACKRGDFDQALAIAALKRAAVDYASQEIDFPQPEEVRDEKVAVIGGGPAGLTAAAELSRLGYPVTLFEAMPLLGGMMRWGIPEYRLPRDILDREIKAVLGHNVEVKTGVRFGEEITLSDLSAQGYKAVFLALGAQKAKPLRVAGEESPGVTPALSFLRRVNLGGKVEVGQKVVVIGGGNTAVDAARTAWRLGAGEVTIVYRRTEKEMPAVPQEIEEARREGIKIEFLVSPVRVLSEGGRASAVECVKMELGEPDSSGRRRPLPIKGSEFTVAADMVLPAIGQEVEFPVAGEGGPAMEWGLLAADEVSLATAMPGVFAGGDVVSGPATVTEAIQAGKRAALSIDRYLRGEPMVSEEDARGLRELRAEEVEIKEKVVLRSRAEQPRLPAAERGKGFCEVEMGLSREEAIAEAQRCLSCAGCGECGECVRVCESGSIDHRAQDELLDVEVGAVVVATGNSLLSQDSYGEYGQGRFPDVLTGLQYERLLSASGPTGGHIKRFSDGKTPKTVAFICCVGSRDECKGRPYCSAVCCMYVAKQAILTKEHEPDAQVFVFNMDYQIGGKNYAQFIKRAQENYGIKYVRGRISKMLPKRGRVELWGTDTMLGMQVKLQADMVVMAVGMDSSPKAFDLAKKLNISHDVYGFFNESHPKLRPVESSTMGVYLAGTCQGPKDIPSTVAQASSVASKVLGLLSKKKLEASPLVAEVNVTRCIGCFRCREVCPFSAVEEQQLRGGRKAARVNPAVCHGCGLCNATCLPGAISLNGFTDEQIISELEALCGCLKK